MVVTAPRFNSDVISNWSQPVSYGFDSMVNDGPGSYGAAKKSEVEKKKQCNDDADAVGQKCTSAYAQLQPICSALTGYFGAKLVSAFWGKAFGELDQKAVEAMKNGAAAAGYQYDDALPSCSALTSKANSFCAAGVKKLKDQCPK